MVYVVTRREARASVCATDKDDPIVCIEIGYYRLMGCFDADAWAHMAPSEARELANDLMEAARKIEAKQKYGRLYFSLITKYTATWAGVAQG